MYRKAIFCSTLAILLLSPVAIGQEIGGGAGAEFKFGVGARALAMGGAYVALADNYTTPYWNPAATTQIGTVDFGAMNTNKYGLGIQYNYLSGAGAFHIQASDLLTLHGAGGVAYLRSSTSGIETFGPGGESTGTISDIGSVVIASYAGGVRIGFLELSIARNTRRYEFLVGDESGTGWAGDYGGLLDISDTFAAGVVISNLEGGRIEWTTGGIDRVRAAVRTGIALRTLDNAIILTAQRNIAGESFRWGTEFQPTELLVGQPPLDLMVRIGSRIPDGGAPQMTAGLGAALFGWLNVDVAFVGNITLGNSVVFSANAQF